MLKAQSNNYLILFVVLCCLTLFSSVWASGGDLREISAEEKKKLFEKFKSFNADVHSMHASVTQEKHLAVMKKALNVEGMVIIAKPNMLRWETFKPERSITVIDGETMTVYHPNNKEAQIYALSENIVARNTAAFFETAMSGSLSEMEKKFAVSIFRDGSEIIFKLIPLSKMAGRYLSSVTIYYDGEVGLPLRFEMETPKGDKTTTRLSNIKTNAELKPDTFKLKLPGDVLITNKFDQNSN